uniref:HTH cro/C1-type domain-containing protein n=1 Tax=Magnetococcus massalia (strain MO-1) TaxID=451514 RepID=A0A1S7LHQ8_MAGMO|nr:Conserved protein of unknown function. Containing helix-turn-helix domain. Putative transcriptional regulator [Candidatus Magnetococcus massalia]
MRLSCKPLLLREVWRRCVMKDQTSESKGILDAVHETAQDLHEIGFINKRRMSEYEALCLKPIPDYDSDRIRALRDRYNLSQSVLASILNTSLSTVRQWEIGKKHPSGPSRKLLDLLERKGLEALI